MGCLQGLTEFLPVSSSGHLVFVQHLFGLTEADAPLAFDTVLHLGSLTAVIIAFRSDLLAIVRDVLAALGQDGLRQGWRNRPYLRVLVWMALATVPAVIVGLTLKHAVEAAFNNVRLVGFAWLVTAALLLISSRFRNGRQTLATMGAGRALLIGLFQAVAITPGVSRSGATIVGGMITGLERETAARFSFLIAIPAILGAGILQLRHPHALPPGFATAAVIGFASAAVVSYGAIRLLMHFVRRGRLHWFAVYCMLIGIVAIFM